jgi:hypothetical protein
MRLGTATQAVASGIAVTLISACAAGIGIGAEPLEQAQAAPTQQSSNPPCGYDVYHGKVYVTSLGKTHGTARVSLQSKRYSYISTNVGSKRIGKGQTITIKPSKRVKANRVTVDIVRGKLTRNESRRKVWHCEAA